MGAYRFAGKSRKGHRHGAVRLLKWLVDRNITPHVPVWDKSARPDGMFSRADFVFEGDNLVWIFPPGAAGWPIAAHFERG